MILIEEMIKLGGETRDKIETAAIATAMKKDIVTHAFAAAACHTAYSYAATTMGEKTKEVTMVEHHGALVGEVQEEFTGRGASWKGTPAQPLAGVGMPLYSPPYPGGGQTSI